MLVGSTDNPRMYAEEWLATIPFAFRIEDGDELRAAVAALASRCADAVAGDPGAARGPTGTPGAARAADEPRAGTVRRAASWTKTR